MTATGNIGQTTVAVRLPQRSAIFDVTATGEFVGVRKLSENHSAPELEIATEWFRELNARVPKPHSVRQQTHTRLGRAHTASLSNCSDTPGVTSPGAPDHRTSPVFDQLCHKQQFRRRSGNQRTRKTLQ
jgi:hypothetical protein